MSSQKVVRRNKIHRRVRNKISGTAARPRLSVFRSNKQIYAQVIDDTTGNTLLSASSQEEAIVAQTGTKKDKARLVGKLIAEKALAANITEIVFDRGGYLYHGRVQQLAEGAREGGLKF